MDSLNPMPELGTDKTAASGGDPMMDPIMRRMLLARALGGQQQAPMPQMSPTGAAMTGFANGMRGGMGMGMQNAMRPALPMDQIGGKGADKMSGLFGWLGRQFG